jgi:hypothetical protein
MIMTTRHNQALALLKKADRRQRLQPYLIGRPRHLGKMAKLSARIHQATPPTNTINKSTDDGDALSNIE